MSNITKLEFTALDISGNNYLSWTLDAELHLTAKNLGETIKENNAASQKDRSQALIFLRHHIDEVLKYEYLTVKDLLVLWNNLRERYEHLKLVLLPQARFDWLNLRFQDYKSVSSYNSALFRITSEWKLCGESITDKDLLEKTLSTFHSSNMLLQQQYREKGFTKYSELISCLLVAERHIEILRKNHAQRPTGSLPLPEVSQNTFPEANATVFYGQRHPRGRGRGRRYGSGRGRGRENGQGHGHDANRTWHHEDLRKVTSNTNKRGRVHDNMGRDNGKTLDDAPVIAHRERHQQGNPCHRCGASDHWSRNCRTPTHLVDLYKTSMKGKLKINHVEFEKPLEDFQVDDLFAPSEGDFMAPTGDFDAVDEDNANF